MEAEVGEGCEEIILDVNREEQHLVQQAQSGEQAGVAGLYRLHAERLYRQVIYPCLADEAAAEDVLKETFVVVMKRIDSYTWDETKGIFPWLARVARNRALDHHRRHARENRGKGAFRHELDRLAPAQGADQLLEEHEEKQLLQEAVRSCLTELNPRYRLALELRLFQECSREECARRLEIQLGTFDVLFHRALQSFRKKWTKKKETKP